MQLKSVEMQGFKSFPDKTVINFSNGITGIVGPNGSGKSNISDAMRWVMGETSAKSLRGNKTEDVIFDGTSARKPLGFAEVSMTLNNIDRSLSLPYDDVIIARRYYRSGESDYFINGSEVRLKDIQELLRDTGLGKTGYSVISQGAITEIIEAKSSDRRTLLEEASGISSFRHKKDESLRRLEQTQANVARLNDIVFELKERLGPLEKQSANARKYLLLRDEKKELEITLWVRRLAQIESELKIAQARSEIFAGDLERTEKELVSKENFITEYTSRVERLSSEIEDIRLKIKEFEDSISEKQTAAVVAKSDVGYIEKEIERLSLSINENEDATRQFDAQCVEKTARKAEMSSKIRECENTISGLKQTLILEEKEEADAEEKINHVETEKARTSDFLTTLQVRLGAVVQSMESENQYAVSRKNEIEEARAKVKDMTSLRLSSEKAITETEEKINECSNILSGYSVKRKNVFAKLDEANKKLTETRISQNDKQNRLNILSGMEAHYDGFQMSVRTVMDEAKRGTLKGIEGTIADIISADSRYSTAIETALGGSLQNIVTSDEKSAKNCIALLKNRNGGRATFLPLSSIRGSSLQAQGLSKEYGFVGIADELVKFDSKYTQIVRYLLGRTAVAEDLDAAVSIAGKYKYSFRIVTLDGQVVNAGGSLTGGSLNKNFGFLSRKNEIEDLKKECVTISAGITELNVLIKARTEELSSVDAALTGAEAEKRNLEERLIKEKGDAEHYRTFEENMMRREEQLNAELALLTQTADMNMSEKDVVESSIRDMEKKQSEISAEAEHCRKEYEATRRKREQTLELFHSTELTLLDMKKDLESVDLAIMQLEQSRIMRNMDSKRLCSDIEDLKKQAEEKNSVAEQLSLEISSASDTIGSFTSDMQSKITERSMAEQKISTFRTEEKALYTQREALVRESEKQTSLLGGLTSERDGTASRIWNEYEYTLTEAETHCVEITDFAAAEAKVNSIKTQMRFLGNVNLDAIDEYTSVKERYDTLTVQINDLEVSRGQLEKLIDELTSKMESTFRSSFELINTTFRDVFRELFDGGQAELKLEDPDNVLESGIEIYAAPPGKIIKNLMALSGGERSLTAIALYFAILKIKPAPFCLLDEIEAALDEVNVVRYAQYLKRSDKTQFIVITHRRGTMEFADSLYGVTMKEKGISKILSVNIEEAEKKWQEEA